jgi:hypothetical protein
VEKEIFCEEKNLKEKKKLKVSRLCVKRKLYDKFLHGLAKHKIQHNTTLELKKKNLKNLQHHPVQDK